MNQRGAVILLVLGTMNLVLFLTCYFSLINNPGSGPEGIGTALMAYASLFLSIILAGVGVNQILNEAQRQALSPKTLGITLFGAAPIVIYLLLDMLPRAIR